MELHNLQRRPSRFLLEAIRPRHGVFYDGGSPRGAPQQHGLRTPKAWDGGLAGGGRRFEKARTSSCGSYGLTTREAQPAGQGNVGDDGRVGDGMLGRKDAKRQGDRGR